MAEPYNINLTTGAEADVRWFSAYARRLILDGLEVHLQYLPTQGTRRLKQLDPNPVAGWELRLGDFRVLYDVDEEDETVVVAAVAVKDGNRFIIDGEEHLL